MSRARILVVDDEEGMVRAVHRVLGGSYDVRCCGLPSEALRTVEEWKPDVALLDIRMPEMSGFELLTRLRAQIRDIDAIIMTGSVHELDTQLVRAIRASAYYFIQKPFDREVLLTLVERCIETRRLQQRNRLHVDRLERELHLARHFQQSLLPPTHAEFGGFELWARCEPCDEMAGDLFDYVIYREGCAAIVVADVAGHGVGAAMQTGVVKAAFRACRDADFDPVVVVEQVARHTQPFPAHRFVTLFCARVGAGQGRLEYVNAGHPPAMVWGEGRQLQSLDSTGPLVSSGLEELSWDTKVLSFGSGDNLLVYTDGIVEVGGSEGEFGQSRIEAQVRTSSGAGAKLLDDTLRAVHDFAAGAAIHDDLTVLTLRCK